jgi:hypothetical protein
MEYDRVLREFENQTRENLKEQSNQMSFGAETEIPLGTTEGEIPGSNQYSRMINQDLIRNLEEAGYEVKEVINSELEPNTDIGLNMASPKESVDNSTPEFDFDLGPQAEIATGAYTDIDSVINEQEELKKIFGENLPDNIKFLDSAFQDPLQRTDSDHQIGWHLLETDKSGLELVGEIDGFPTPKQYYPDYVNLLGPAVATNAFGGSTQLTGPVKGSEDPDSLIYEFFGGDQLSRIALEEGKDPLTSNAFIVDDNEINTTDIGAPYWEAAYKTSFMPEEEIEDRQGYPVHLVDRIKDSEGENALNEFIDHILDYSRIFIKNPGSEYIELDEEPDQDVDFDEFKILAGHPDEPTSFKDYIEDEEIRFSKVVGTDGEYVSGTIDISEKDDKLEYFWDDMQLHEGTVHHNVRLKPTEGLFEQRTDRNTREYEPQVVTLQAALKDNWEDVVSKAANEYGWSDQDMPDPREEPETYREFWEDAKGILEEGAENVTVENSDRPQDMVEYIEETKEKGNPAEKRLRREGMFT